MDEKLGEVLDALEEHDTDLAESLMMAHLADISRSLLAALGGIE